MDHKAYELDIPKEKLTDGLTPVFHPWKLHLASTSPYPGQISEPCADILTFDYGDTEPHPEYEVTEIVDFRETRRWGVQYKATFAGERPDWNNSPPWQPWTDFLNAKDLILEYHRLNPSKPPPPEGLISHVHTNENNLKAQGTSPAEEGDSVRPPSQTIQRLRPGRRHPGRRSRRS